MDEVLDALQRTLHPLDDTDGALGPDRTVVVIPSIDLDADLVADLGAALPAYEERSLYLLFMLARPQLRMVYVTSVAVPEDVVDYYLSLVPGTDLDDARGRLSLVSLGDPALTPLARKLLDRPAAMDELREVVGDPTRAFIAPFNVARAERDLAVALGLPIYGPDSRFYRYGTKSGSRTLFAEEGVAHPRGSEDVATLDDVVEGVVRLRAARPPVPAVVVKQNDSGYGEGNVVVHLDGTPALPPPGSTDERTALTALLRERLDDEYLRKLALDPGIVEELLIGEEVRSPSVQVRIMAHGGPGLVSAQDQVLGGANGQAFVGARFPADERYTPQIVAETDKVRRRLAAEGVVGRFGVDFVVARQGDTWQVAAVEINLREGGTSHPYGTLFLLTGGTVDPTGGTYRTDRGHTRYLVASDDIEDPGAAGTPVARFLAAARDAGLTWDPERQRGVVFHMLHTLPSLGRVGVTAVGESREDADRLFDECHRLMATLGRDGVVVLDGQ